jgi:hypothetical protein
VLLPSQVPEYQVIVDNETELLLEEKKKKKEKKKKS